MQCVIQLNTPFRFKFIIKVFVNIVYCLVLGVSVLPKMNLVMITDNLMDS